MISTLNATNIDDLSQSHSMHINVDIVECDWKAEQMRLFQLKLFIKSFNELERNEMSSDKKNCCTHLFVTWPRILCDKVDCCYESMGQTKNAQCFYLIVELNNKEKK